MRLSRSILFLLAIGLFLNGPVAWAWEIERFDVDLSVQSDGSVLVREKIRVNFQEESRHGIYRDIPIVTQDRAGIHRSIRLTFLTAVDEEGRPWDVRLSREGAFQRIRLGSPGITYQGRRTFELTYRVERILQSFPDHDELYWNVTGNEWSVPMGEATATVRLPEPVPSGQLRATAYTGWTGSSASDAQIVLLGEKAVRYVVSRSLSAFEGLTIVAGWPHGLIPPATLIQKIRWFLQILS